MNKIERAGKCACKVPTGCTARDDRVVESRRAGAFVENAAAGGDATASTVTEDRGVVDRDRFAAAVVHTAAVLVG